MTERIVQEGPGFVIVQTDHWGPAVPYPGFEHEDGDRNHGFTDLRDRPDLVASIPEAQKSMGLAALLRAINEPCSPLMSLGCECAYFDQEGYVGGYIDVTFRDPRRNADPKALIGLATSILTGVPGNEVHYMSFAMVVEPLKLFFNLPGRYGLMMKPQGHGRLAADAWRAFDHAALALAGAVRSIVKTDPR